LFEAHPEWRDLPLAVLDPDGNVESLSPEAFFTEDVTTAVSDTDPTPTLVKVLVLGT
jgi:hypothetical protein